MTPRTMQIKAPLENTRDFGKGPQIDPTQFPQRYGFPTKLYRGYEFSFTMKAYAY
jgi:hypothetical protein